MNVIAPEQALSPKDYASDQEIRWCPGCGDYAILKAVQRTLAEVQAPREKTVFISGIGCAARFPYYLSTYGFHTIHGRAAPVATGLKLANPELDVWVVSGDGDSLSIGGNHLLHLLRRDVNLQYLLFNNEIYGLTKGQASPTSRLGTSSPSTPTGSQDAPVSAVSFALGAGARFVARAVDTQQKQLPEVLKAARAHNGTALVEILQNCIVYNDNVFGDVTDRAVADDAQIHVVHGEPLIFGKDRDKGLRINPNRLALEVVSLANGVAQEEILRHDQTNRTLAGLLGAMAAPDFPVALGVLYQDPSDGTSPNDSATVGKRTPELSRRDLNELLRQGHTWTLDGRR